MDGAELRRRLDRLGRTYTELAPLLGLSTHGLHKQMRGVHAVSRQTELLLEQLESGCDAKSRGKNAVEPAENHGLSRCG
jgi:hypothetical protein